MATLEQLAGNVGAKQQGTGLGVSSAPKPQSAEFKAEAISKDVLGILGKASDVRQMHNTLSVGVAQRNATSNLVERDVAIGHLMTQAEQPNANFRQIKQDIETVHQFYGTPTFENEDAQTKFDMMYHVEGSKSVAVKKQLMEKRAFKQDADYLYKNSLEATEALVKGGSFSDDVKETLLDSMDSTGGYYTKKQLENDMASIVATDFAQTTNPNDFIMEGGKINAQAVKDYTEFKLGNFIEFDKDGQMVFKTDDEGIIKTIGNQSKVTKSAIDSQAKTVRLEYEALATRIGQAALYNGQPYKDENGVWHRHAGSFANYESIVSSQFPELTKEAHTQIMNLYKEATTDAASGNAQYTNWFFENKKFEEFNANDEVYLPHEYDKQIEWGQHLIQNTELSATKKNNIKNKITLTKRLQNRSIVIRTNMHTISVQDAQKNIAKGNTIDGFSVGGDTYKAHYEKHLAERADIAKDINVDSQEGQVALNKEFNATARDAKILKIKNPPLFQQYKNNFEDVSGGAKSLNEMKQSVAYYRYATVNGDQSMKHYEPYMVQLEQIIMNTDEDVTDVQRTNRGNAYMQGIANNVTAKKNDVNTKKFFTTSTEYIASGERYLDFTAIPVPTDTDQHMMEIYTGVRTEAEIQSHVDSYEYYDSGVGGYDEYRVAVPKGLAKREFGGYVDHIVDGYNGGKSVFGFGDKIDTDDIYFEVGNDGTDLTYRINTVVNGKVRHIGNITSENYEYIKGRQ